MTKMITSSANAQVWSGRVLQFSREGRQCDHDPSALEVISLMMMMMMLMALVNLVVVMKAKKVTMGVLLIIRNTKCFIEKKMLDTINNSI